RGRPFSSRAGGLPSRRTSLVESAPASRQAHEKPHATRTVSTHIVGRLMGYSTASLCNIRQPCCRSRRESLSITFRRILFSTLRSTNGKAELATDEHRCTQIQTRSYLRIHLCETVCICG